MQNWCMQPRDGAESADSIFDRQIPHVGLCTDLSTVPFIHSQISIVSNGNDHKSSGSLSWCFDFVVLL
jgi:hypothetical protein